jgi:2-methylcitrate dehydratase PrpD
MTQHVPAPPTVADEVARFAAELDPARLPPEARAMVRRLLVDVAGLAAAARHTDYVAAVLASCGGPGSTTSIGHARPLGGYDAALVNGTAAHGEDFDDTFEGGPVHAGAVVVPAVLAAAEEEALDGRAVVKGVAVGVEVMCRASLVAPQAIHKAGFHPTAVIGALAAAAGVGAALGLSREAIARALGTAGSLASGIIEYLADGSSTKRLHAGWAAQAGLRAARLARGGFIGPRTVFEGAHGFFKAFAPSKQPDFSKLTDGLGARFVGAEIAFKPYACGTMTQPFVDCAIALAREGVTPENVTALHCFVGEGTVHRLWEPLALKRRPPNGYAGKFSTPYCVAAGLVEGAAGLALFTDERVKDERLLAVAGKVVYEIDPADEYPKNFTGRIVATLNDGTTREARQPHMRGGAREPLSDADILAKYRENCAFAGWTPERAERVRAALERVAEGGPVDLAETRG